MNPIDQLFQRLRAQGRMAFIAFLTAGDPDLATTLAAGRELARAGADLIEVGFPYSDPIADGPVIQASYTRALGNRVKLKQIFSTIAAVTREIQTPLIGMVSYAIIFRYGIDAFAKIAAESGFSGLIVPDLPGDEAAGFASIMSANHMDLIQLIAPTTPPARAAKI